MGMGRYMGYIGMYKVAYDIFPPFRKWRPDIYKLERYVIQQAYTSKFQSQLQAITLGKQIMSL